MQDVTPAETLLMQEHGVYWRQRVAEGQVVVFGPVADPSGPYGLAIIRLEDGEDPLSFGQQDPAIKAKAGFTFTVSVMPQAVLP